MDAVERQCSTLSREICQQLLNHVSIQVYDTDSIEDLRQAVFLNVKDGTIDPDVFLASFD